MNERINDKKKFLTLVEVKGFWIYYFALLILVSCNQQKQVPATSSISRVWQFEQILPIFQKNNDTTYVINFWATTCPPCIKELPYFEKINQLSNSKPIKVVLINRDLEKHFEKRVIPFVKKHHLHSEIIALHDENMSKWLDLVYSKWWGALPFTMIYKGDNKKFYLDPFETYEDLENAVLNTL